MPILISGSMVYDYIMNFPDSFKNHILPDQLHILSVSFVANRLVRGFGGTAGNIAYTIKLLGGEPIIVSALGQDDEPYIAHLTEHHITTEHIMHDPKVMTASAHITTDADDNQITAFFPGPLADAKTINLTKLKGELALISPTDKEVMITHLNQAADANKTVVFDPGQQITAFSGVELSKLIGRADYLIGNDYELKLLTERTGKNLADFLKDDLTIITTLGSRGSRIQTAGEQFEIKACEASSVDDPTGAGDAYRAAFFVGLNKKLPLKICGQMGSVAATFAVESYGTQTHQYSLSEFGTRYQKTFGETLAL